MAPFLLCGVGIFPGGPLLAKVNALSGRKPRRRISGDLIFKRATLLAALSIPLFVLGSAIELTRGAGEAIRRFGFSFLFQTSWDPVNLKFGALPFIYGTLVSSLLALLIAVPISLGTALFLAEIAPWWLRDPLSFIVELLAAIPSVIFGLWGIFALAPWLRSTAEPALKRTLGFLPFFQGPAYGIGMLAAGLILAIMILPIITSVTRELFLSTPVPLKEGALALGASWWEMVQAVFFPHARSGILGAIILGLGRALGETMAVTMVVGNRPQISLSLFAPGYTIAAVLANEFSEADSNLYLSALIEIGLILFLITLLVNGAARWLIWKSGWAAAKGGSGP